MIHRTSLLKVGDPYSLLGLFEGGGRAQRMSGGFSARMSTQSLRGHCSQAKANNNLRPLAAEERKVLRKDAPENFSGALLAAREQNNPENFAGLDQHGVSAIRPKSAPGSGTVPFGRSHGALMSTEIAIPSAQSGVSTFTFDGHTIRVVEIEGEPWFVAIDVSNALRLERTMFHQRVRALSDDQRRTMTKLVVENTTSSPLLVASPTERRKLIAFKAPLHRDRKLFGHLWSERSNGPRLRERPVSAYPPRQRLPHGHRVPELGDARRPPHDPQERGLRRRSGDARPRAAGRDGGDGGRPRGPHGRPSGSRGEPAEGRRMTADGRLWFPLPYTSLQTGWPL